MLAVLPKYNTTLSRIGLTAVPTFNVVVPVDFKSDKDLEHEKRVNQILGK